MDGFGRDLGRVLRLAGWLPFLFGALAGFLAARACSAQVPPAFNYPAAGPAGATGATGATGPTGPAGPGPLVSFLAADATNATATMAATGISLSLTNGTKYACLAELRINAGAGADGSVFDFGASTTTVSNFWASWLDQSLVTPTEITSSLAADFTGPTTGVAVIQIAVSAEPSSTGTLAIRFSQASHLSETLTVNRGSWLICWPAS